jgi:glycosyltransferase involved in cell wall biosynthesis
MAAQKSPLISCLCVTKNSERQLQRAVDCFQAQSYTRRELILVFQEHYTAAAAWLEKIRSRRIKVIQVRSSEKLSLGALRNIAVDQASGDYICQWDDDDWYHRDRLKIQLAQARAYNHPAAYLTYCIIYHVAGQQAYFSTFRLWENSILCKRSVLRKIGYPDQTLSEDAHVLHALIRTSRVYPVVHPGLYIYVYHGDNTCDGPHFEKLFAKSQQLSRSASREVGQILAGKYSVAEASARLLAPPLQQEINCFYSNQRFLEEQDTYKKQAMNAKEGSI